MKLKIIKYFRNFPRASQQFCSFTRKRETSITPIGYLLLLVPTGTFCLGSWQIQRRKWKLKLINDIHKATSAAPIQLPSNPEDVTEYQRVIVRGTFLHSQEMYIHPRSLIQPDQDYQKSSGLVSQGGQNGAWVVTPFKLADRNQTILVNRGWVPRKRISPETRLAGQVNGTTDIQGIVRQTEKRQSNNGSWVHPFWQWRDIEGMSAATGAIPVFIDACSLDGPTHPDAPVPGQTRLNLRNEHLSYIITWYSLSAITAFLWYRRFK